MPNEISEIARKWAQYTESQLGVCTCESHMRILEMKFQHAIDEATAHQTDPLPVMEDNAIWFEEYLKKGKTKIMETDRNVARVLFMQTLRLIAQLKRERGLTEAAEHMRKLKEADNE